MPDNKYIQLLKSKFGEKVEVEVFENYIGDPKNPIKPCLSVRIGIDFDNGFYPCEIFQLPNSNSKRVIEELAPILYKQKAYNLWVRCRNVSLKKGNYKEQYYKFNKQKEVI